MPRRLQRRVAHALLRQKFVAEVVHRRHVRRHLCRTASITHAHDDRFGQTRALRRASMHVPRVVRGPRSRAHDDRELGQLRRHNRVPFATGEARIGDRLLREVRKHRAGNHDAERPADVRPGSAQHALDERLLVRRHRVVRRRARDAPAAEIGHRLPHLLDRRRLCLPGLRRDHHHTGRHGSANETCDDQLETHLSP